MNVSAKPSFMSAMKSFFGLKDGQTALQFGKEMKELTGEDRAYFSRELNKAGIEHEAPASA